MRIFILFFSLALLIRVSFICFQGYNLEEHLIEDELLYWKNSLSYLDTGVLNKDILDERMPSIFIYYKTLLWVTSKNIKFLLFIQAAIDSISCFMIFKIASLIVAKQKFYIYGFAIFSPLMIILSSQILSETIFLLCFSFFLYFSVKTILCKNKIFFYIFLAGLFLGVSTSLRSITFPLIFLLLIPFTIIFLNKKVPSLNIFIILSLFLFSALLPVSFRLINNIKMNNTYALTSQTGTHLAYWIAPMILSESESINRTDAIKIITNEKNKYLFTEDSYKNDLILRKVGFNIISTVSLGKVMYSWGKGIFINISAPSILLDKKLRSFPHPSYYEVANPLKWIKALISKKKYHNYFLIVLFFSITSIFSILSFIIGPILLYKQNKQVSYLCLLYTLYFMIITGPIVSPKYIFPMLPCVFIYQAITLIKIKDFFYYSYKRLKKT